MSTYTQCRECESSFVGDTLPAHTFNGRTCDGTAWPNKPKAPTYNGWKNRPTWNVALWIGNDQGLYEMAKDIVRRNRRTPYAEFVETMTEIGSIKTPDGYAWDSRELDRRALNSMMRELVD